MRTLFKIMAILACCYLTANVSQGSAAYQDAKKALRAKQWNQAIALFEDVARNNEAEADAALYWQAYAQDRAQQKEAAISTIKELISTYPDSSWREDAQALATSIRRQAGQAVSPGDVRKQTRMAAVAALLTVNAEEALPIVKDILAGDGELELKEKALFVLSHHNTTESGELLTDYAMGHKDPKLQRRSLEILGISATKESINILQQAYDSADRDEVRHWVLQSWMIAGAREPVLAIAESNEGSQDVRNKAIRMLGVMGAFDELKGFYNQASNDEIKEVILDSMFTGTEIGFLEEVVANETSEKLRRSAIRKIGMSGGCEHLERLWKRKDLADYRDTIMEATVFSSGCNFLIEVAKNNLDLSIRKKAMNQLAISNIDISELIKELYAEDQPLSVRKDVFKVLFLRQDVDTIIEIAREEQNEQLKSEAVKYLGLIGGSKARAFLLEILD